MSIEANANLPIPCSLVSLQRNEPLIGTAPRADVWFLLEYSDRWGNKALKESSIPEDVKVHLKVQLDLIPESRLLLIKRSTHEIDGIAFFAALPALDKPTLYKFHLKDYSDLLDYDLTAIANQESGVQSAAATQENLFVMCTNGLRDQCCALHGVSTFNSLQGRFDDFLWQSTHHGGHRFATNLLHFPYGHSYGRLRPETAGSVIQAALEGSIAVDHHRGRTIFPEPIQAGEILLRQKLGLDSVRALRLANSEQENGNWRVRFSENGQTHEIVVSPEEGLSRIHLSCGDEKTSPVKHYRLVEHKVL